MDDGISDEVRTFWMSGDADYVIRLLHSRPALCGLLDIPAVVYLCKAVQMFLSPEDAVFGIQAR